MAKYIQKFYSSTNDVLNDFKNLFNPDIKVSPNSTSGPSNSGYIVKVTNGLFHGYKIPQFYMDKESNMSNKWVTTIKNNDDGNSFFAITRENLLSSQIQSDMAPLIMTVSSNKKYKACMASNLDQKMSNSYGWNVRLYSGNMPMLDSNELRLYPAYFAAEGTTFNILDITNLYFSAWGDCQAGTKVIDTNGNRFLALGGFMFVKLDIEDEW